MNILITGGAGFIGSNLAEYLLEYNLVHSVTVIDNLSTGKIENLVKCLSYPNFKFIEGDIRDYALLVDSFKNMDIVSHQAALGSVPRSVEDPITTHSVNTNGSLNVLKACVECGVKRVILAGSSSVYGTNNQIPKVEDNIGAPLSPYAVTKYTMELYAHAFMYNYGLEYIVLRYFNVFGPRQGFDNPYAAVIPTFCKAIIQKNPIQIFGDGNQYRDFTFVSNVIDANVKAMFCANPQAINQIYNIACGEKITINQLAKCLLEYAKTNNEIIYLPERRGDIKNSMASIDKAQQLLGYNPIVKVYEGLRITLDYYKNTVRR
jgi:UDP-N-acetylglucosamine 4-epimerase